MRARCVSVFFILCVALTGCGKPSWEGMSAPDVTGVDAMAAVESFVAVNGWNMQTNGVLFAYGFDHPLSIRGLPWRSLRVGEFPALTHEGILYVALAGRYHDCHGVAYNPKTNRFAPSIAGFKPIGGHWYVWAQTEFPMKLDKIYEGQ